MDTADAERLNSAVVMLIDDAEQEVARGHVVVLEPLRRLQRQLECVPGMFGHRHFVAGVLRVSVLRRGRAGGGSRAGVIARDLRAQILGVRAGCFERVGSVTWPREQAEQQMLSTDFPFPGASCLFFGPRHGCSRI